MSNLPASFQVLIGLAFTAVAGLAVGPLVRWATKEMSLPPPSSRLTDQWARVVEGNEGGRALGHLERIVFFGAFWAGLQSVIAGYLAFKVASKWNAWSNIVAVPKEIPGLDPLEYLIARRCWGSHVLVTFLFGTLANVMVAYLGMLAGQQGINALCAVVC